MSSRYTEGSLSQRDNARTQLFGSAQDRNNDTNTPISPYGNNEKLDYSQSTLAQLESQSDDHVGQMGQRIKALKSLSLKMGDEIRNGNHSLNDLGTTFDNTKVKLKGTFDNMMIMAKKSRISIKTWLLIFSVVGLLFFWVWIT